MRWVLAIALLAALAVAAMVAPRWMDLAGEVAPPVSRVRAERLNSEAVALLQAGEPARAIGLLREAVLLDAGNLVTAGNLASGLVLLSEQAGVAEAEKESLLEESLALRPGDARALGDLAALLYRQKRYRDAYDAVSLLVDADPADAIAVSFRQRLSERIRETDGMVFEEGRGFTLVYSGRERLAFEGDLMVLLQREREDLSVALGLVPRRDLEVLILTPDLGEKGERPDPGVGAIYDGRIRLFLGAGKPNLDALRGTLRHELLHAFLFQISLAMPAWLQEGLAQKEGERVSSERIADYRLRLMQAMAEGWWVSPLSLQDTLMELRPEERPMAYAVSLLFVDFLERKYGPSFVPRLLAAMREGKTLEESAREVTGASPAEWERLFAGEMGKG